MMSPFSYNSPYGMMGGSYPNMGQSGMGMFGGYNGYNPYQYMGMFGGYNPYQYMGMYNPQMMGGDFMSQWEAKLNDMFAKYFPEQKSTSQDTTASSTPAAPQDTTTGSTPAASQDTTTGVSEKKYSDKLGRRFANTGEFGSGGVAEIKAMGYKDERDFLTNDPYGQKLRAEYEAKQNQAPEISAAGRTPRGAGGRNAPRTR